MVGGALALDLDQDPHVSKVGTDPLVEGGEELESVRCWGHVHCYGAAILRGGLGKKLEIVISHVLERYNYAGLTSRIQWIGYDSFESILESIMSSPGKCPHRGRNL